MGAIVSEIISLTIVYSNVYSDEDQRKHQSSASLAFVRGIHRSPVNSPHKWSVTRKMFPFDDVIMFMGLRLSLRQSSTPVLMRHRQSSTSNMVLKQSICETFYCCKKCSIWVETHGFVIPLQWCHNGHHAISNHQPHHYLLNRKENIKAPLHWPLCGEFTGPRWIPRTNGQ